MKRELTKLQQEILDAIDSYRSEYGSSPLPAELAKEMDIEKPRIYRWLASIELKGYIELVKPHTRIVIKRIAQAETRRKKKQQPRPVLADGEYIGEWNGHDVIVRHRGARKQFIENVGIIGVFMPCVVNVRGGVPIVKLKE